jgi:hypothetical protein
VEIKALSPNLHVSTIKCTIEGCAGSPSRDHQNCCLCLSVTVPQGKPWLDHLRAPMKHHLNLEELVISEYDQAVDSKIVSMLQESKYCTISINSAVTCSFYTDFNFWCNISWCITVTDVTVILAKC